MNTLHLVFGGELVHPTTTKYRDPDNIDYVGIFETVKEARDRWKGKAQLTVDNAHMRYVVIPLDATAYDRALVEYAGAEDVNKAIAVHYAKKC